MQLKQSKTSEKLVRGCYQLPPGVLRKYDDGINSASAGDGNESEAEPPVQGKGKGKKTMVSVQLRGGQCDNSSISKARTI
jgi:hypothetical protein